MGFDFNRNQAENGRLFSGSPGERNSPWADRSVRTRPFTVAAGLARSIQWQFASFAGDTMALPEFNQLCNEAKQEIEEITPDDLRVMQKMGEDFALIDVREREESANGIIPNAVAIPRGIVELTIDQVTLDKNRKIVLYCGGGSRSALAAWMLKKMGFKNVISLAGGYCGWMQSQL
jgi:rhodanese-related sulfurtransferase